MKNQITSYTDGESVFIKLPLEILKWAQEHHPTHPCEILDEKEMGKWFSENILEYGDGEHDSKFYELIDDMFEDAMEYGQEEWIDSVDWET
jgi:hypothetical protein